MVFYKCFVCEEVLETLKSIDGLIHGNLSAVACWLT